MRTNYKWFRQIEVIARKIDCQVQLFQISAFNQKMDCVPSDFKLYTMTNVWAQKEIGFMLWPFPSCEVMKLNTKWSNIKFNG